MNNATTTPKLDQLRQNFEAATQELNTYSEAKGINDFYDGDYKYLELLLARMEAYKAMKQEELSEFKFTRFHAPVINERIRRIKSRMSNLKSGGY